MNSTYDKTHTLLIVEGDRTTARSYAASVGERMHYIVASNLKDALTYPSDDFDAVLVGEHIAANIDDVVSAIKSLRHSGFCGPILIASSDKTVLSVLMFAGATRGVFEQNLGQPTLDILHFLETNCSEFFDNITARLLTNAATDWDGSSDVSVAYGQVAGKPGDELHVDVARKIMYANTHCRAMLAEAKERHALLELSRMFVKAYDEAGCLNKLQ